MLNFELLIPELTLAGTAIVVILLDLVVKSKWWLAAVSIAGIVVSTGFAIAMWGGDSESIFFGMMAVDNFAIFFKLLFLVIAALVILASTDYVSKLKRFQGEYYALVLISALGMMLMAATTELISIYIALELTSISLYILVGFLKDPKSTEASLKYLLLGAVASAVLLFGMALIFGSTGQTQLGDIAAAIQVQTFAEVLASPGLIAGIVLIIAGFGFKIAAVPFHMWVPDVYEGAPTPVTAYLSVGSKAAGFAILLRVFFSAFGLPEWLSLDWGLVFAILAAVGMTVGNIIALTQTNIKRMLGYSSIAQAGYLMVGLATVGFVSPVLSDSSVFAGQSGLLFFLASYALTNLGAFTAIIAISDKIDSDAAGFMAKFYIFSGAAQHGLLWLVIIAVISFEGGFSPLLLRRPLYGHYPRFRDEAGRNGGQDFCFLSPTPFYIFSHPPPFQGKGGFAPFKTPNRGLERRIPEGIIEGESPLRVGRVGLDNVRWQRWGGQIRSPKGV